MAPQTTREMPCVLALSRARRDDDDDADGGNDGARARHRDGDRSQRSRTTDHTTTHDLSLAQAAGRTPTTPYARSTNTRTAVRPLVPSFDSPRRRAGSPARATRRLGKPRCVIARARPIVPANKKKRWHQILHRDGDTPPRGILHTTPRRSRAGSRSRRCTRRSPSRRRRAARAPRAARALSGAWCPARGDARARVRPSVVWGRRGEKSASIAALRA